MNKIFLILTFLSSSCLASDINTRDIRAPASSTDNAVVRFDGTTGRQSQNSGVRVTDLGALQLPESGGADLVTLQVPSLVAAYTLTLPTDDGAASQFLQTNGAGVLTWDSAAATPAGADGNVQYNNGGVFGGEAELFWDDTNNRLEVVGNVRSTSGLDYAALENSGGEPLVRLFNDGIVEATMTAAALGLELSSGSGRVHSLAPFAVYDFGLISAASAASAANFGGGTLNLWSASGGPSFISFTETGVANRGTVGFEAGSSALVFKMDAENITGGTERMRLTNGGRLGVGTVAPSARLNVRGTVDEVQMQVSGNSPQTGNILLVDTNSGQNLFRVRDAQVLVDVGAVIDGAADEIQLRVKGHSTQTTDLTVIENDAGTDLMNVQSDGAVVISEAGGNGGNVFHGYERVVGTTQVGDDECTVDCDAGSKIVGGGCLSSNAVALVYQTYPLDEDTWQCRLSTTLADCTAYALCAQY